MKGRLGSCALLLMAAVVHSQMAAQDEPRHSPFGCSGHAVQLALDPNPPLQFVSLTVPPGEVVSLDPQHKFRFAGAGPFAAVTIHLTATVAEQPAGRAISAKLGVYAQTTSEDRPQGPWQFWQLVSTSKSAGPNDPTSARLAIDASRVAECMRSDDPQCSFAQVATATPDTGIPIFDLSFTEDLGGANAENSQEAHLLPDFRASPPRVLGTLDCAYNEGGGACTAIDSGMAPRSDLQCDWAGEKNDFLCSEVTDAQGEAGAAAHRDYYLSSAAAAPLKAGEVATLVEAAQRLKVQPGTSVKVRSVGVVGWVGELTPASQEKLIVLGSQTLEGGARFYLIPESKGGLGVPAVIWPRELLDDDKPSKGTLDGNDWTVDKTMSFVSRTLYEDRDLSVLQVVAKAEWNRLYWIGVGSGQPTAEVDAVELAGGSRYGNCGNHDIPASAVAVKNISRPFRAVLQIQPPTVVSEGDARPIAWADSTDEEPMVDCLRAGEMRWAAGRFQGTMQQSSCKTADQPGYVRVDDTGIVTVSYQTKP